MDRIKNLDRFQKSVLLAMAAMLLGFSVLYPVTLGRVGFDYHDAILVPRAENGRTVYAGKIDGEPAQFTVSAEKAVVFQWGGTTYGPYTAKEDPTAVPQGDDRSGGMTGVELRCGETVVFRGGVAKSGQSFLLFNEDGTWEGFQLSYSTGDGTLWDENGSPIDPMEPSPQTVLALMAGPELTHRGNVPGWFLGALICVLNALSILFADELFRFALALRARNIDRAEPSDFELAGRYVSWAALTVLAFVLFVLGLR